MAPAAVFEFLLASSGAIALLVYLVIAVSQLRMRQKRIAAGETLVFKMWLFPGLTYAVMVFIVGTLTIMLFQEAHRGRDHRDRGLELAGGGGGAARFESSQGAESSRRCGAELM